MKNYQVNQLRSDTFASDYAKLILNSLPQDSILITNLDDDLYGQIGYMRYVENFRTDVKIVSQADVVFPERFFNRKNEKDLKEKPILFLNYITPYMDKGIRIFTTRKISAFNDNYKFPLSYQQYGLYLEILAPGTKSILPVSETVDAAKQYLTQMEKNKYANQWQYYRNFAVQSLCRFLIPYKEEHPLFQKNRWCKLVRAESLSAYRQEYREADNIFSEIIEEPMTDIFIYERNLIYQQFLINKVHFVNRLPISKAEKHHIIAEAITKVFPKVKELELCNNPLAHTIKELDAQMQLPIDREYLLKTFGTCK